MLVVRAYVVTIFTVPNDTLKPTLQKGDRIMVYKRSCADLKVGNVVLFDEAQPLLGKVIAVPGDTINVQGTIYRIPAIRQKHCPCSYCSYYLIGIGHKQMLIQRCNIVGKAHFLFRWKR